MKLLSIHAGIAWIPLIIKGKILFYGVVALFFMP